MPRFDSTITLEQPTTAACCLPGITPRLSDSEAQAAALLLKALADPARLQILDVLAQHERLVCVCDLEGIVGVPDPETGQRPKQPTISHHLKVLRLAGLVDYEKRGQWAYYAVRRERLAAAQALIAHLGAAR
ncbi:MAG: helix-turn-helix transcriptional regulator [Chloroflexaceae bacterium]|nr:helix-turn-helix transcriptional regulator [Chloroflexaceae bacterium]NJO05119.1 helix-turn-helix transcriptional regulator [Chloroflexaceae bacterium]